MSDCIDIIAGAHALGRGDPAIASIGTFDGMHQGHRSVLSALRSRSRCTAQRALAITFHPRPELVLCPERALPDLASLEQRISAIQAAGAEDVVVIRFTPQFARLPVADFLDWLRRDCAVTRICVGEDFRIGPRAAYTVPMIRQLGMPVEAVPLVPSVKANAKASSTHIREALARGVEFPMALQYA